MQGLWQAYYQIMLVILLNEWIKLNVNMDSAIKKMMLAELNTKIANAFLNTQTFKMI